MAALIIATKPPWWERVDWYKLFDGAAVAALCAGGISFLNDSQKRRHDDRLRHSERLEDLRRIQQAQFERRHEELAEKFTATQMENSRALSTISAGLEAVVNQIEQARQEAREDRREVFGRLCTLEERTARHGVILQQLAPSAESWHRPGGEI